MDFSSKSMKSQMRHADKQKCAFALILGENELKSGKWVLKNMRDGAQETIDARTAIDRAQRHVEQVEEDPSGVHGTGPRTPAPISS